jgi:hypothetical protein
MGVLGWPFLLADSGGHQPGPAAQHYYNKEQSWNAWALWVVVFQVDDRLAFGRPKTPMFCAGNQTRTSPGSCAMGVMGVLGHARKVARITVIENHS